MSPGHIRRVREQLHEMERSLKAVEDGKNEEHYQLYLGAQAAELASYIASEAFLSCAPPPTR